MELSKKDIDFLVSILKKYIDTSLATITNRGRIKVHHFEEQYMRTVNGGLPLDQSLFRTYLQTCGKVNVWIDSDKTGELPTDGDQDVLYFLWVDGSYVMYIYTDTYVLITTTTQIDDLNVSGTTTYSSQKIISLIVTSCLGMSYNNLISGLQSTNAQDAIDELKFLIDSVKPTGGGSVEHDDTLNKNGNTDFLHITETEKTNFVTASDFVEDFISNATAITREGLLALINNNQLIPSSSYRITDYTTTTVQADTQSAGHNFDIVVTALSTNELSENAECVRKDGDTYFANAKLEAWEIKYCIDNDTTRFAWADTENGKGVIYYMKDEWGNECPYDFKNIQFKRYPIISMPDGSTDLVFDADNQKMKYALKDSDGNVSPTGAVIDESNPSYYFTFNAILQDSETYDIYDASIIQNGIKNDESGDFIVQNNKISEAHTSSDNPYYYGQLLKLNDIVMNNVINSLVYTELSYGCYSNTFGNDCNYNTFGNSCYFNTFGNDCNYNTFGNSCGNNTFGALFSSNTFGDSCYYNTFGNNCYSNTFGNNCYYNTFGNSCGSNTFGDSCYYNTFGNSCYSNNFYTGTSGTTKKDYIRYIVLEDGCQLNNFYSNVTTSSNNYLQRIRIKGLENTTPTSTQITLSAVNNKYEWVICYTSGGELKQYCPDDRLTYKIEDTSVSTWVASTKYANFGYEAQINIANLTEDDFVNVVFSVTDANSGNYAAAVEQYAGYILIFASVNTAITIPTIVVNKIDL